MKSIKEIFNSRRKVIVYPILVMFVLVSIFIFNGFQTENTTMVATKEGTFIEASGMVENNSIDLSSEVNGIIAEVKVNEGDTIEEGQIIAEINNSTIKNQYEQAMDNLKIAEKNVAVSQESLESYKAVYADSTEQAKSAYNSSLGEYEKVLEGASTEEIRQAEEAYKQADINLKHIEDKLEDSKTLLEHEVIAQREYDEIEKNYNIALTQFNIAGAKLDQVKAGPSDATKKAVENKMLQAKASYELSISNGSMQLNQLQSQLEIAQLKYDQAKTIAKQLEEELSKTNITSPINGIINLLTINKGEFTSLGKQVAEIFDIKDMKIKVYVSEANIGHIKVGQEVKIQIDSETEETFTGKVIKINNNAEFTPKNIQTKEERVNTVFEVKIQVDDSKGIIKSGMPVDVSIKID